MERKLFSHLEPTAALAAKILFKLDELCGFTGTIAKRRLERLMNANKQPLWPAAWQLLMREGCIEISPGKKRQQLVKLAGMPEHLRPRCIVIKLRRRRKQTEWFKEHLPEFLRRDGYDDRAEEIDGEDNVDDEETVTWVYAPGDPLAR